MRVKYLLPSVISIKPVLDLIGECEASSQLISPTFIHLIIYFYCNIYRAHVDYNGLL